MSRKSYVNSMIKKYGISVEIIRPDPSLDTETTKAFVQPLRFKSSNERAFDIGFCDRERYWYIGCTDVRLDTYPIDTIVKTSNGSYTVRRADRVFINEDILYIVGVLEKCVD